MNVPKNITQVILDNTLKKQDYLGGWRVGKFALKKCMSGLFTQCKEIKIWNADGQVFTMRTRKHEKNDKHNFVFS